MEPTRIPHSYLLYLTLAYQKAGGINALSIVEVFSVINLMQRRMLPMRDSKFLLLLYPRVILFLLCHCILDFSVFP